MINPSRTSSRLPFHVSSTTMGKKNGPPRGFLFVLSLSYTIILLHVQKYSSTWNKCSERFCAFISCLGAWVVVLQYSSSSRTVELYGPKFRVGLLLNSTRRPTIGKYRYCYTVLKYSELRHYTTVLVLLIVVVQSTKVGSLFCASIFISKAKNKLLHY